MSEPSQPPPAPSQIDIVRQLADILAATESTRDMLLGKISEMARNQLAIKADLTEKQDIMVSTIYEVKQILTDNEAFFVNLVGELGDRLSGDQNKLRAEIMDRIDRLQGTVELIREDGRVNWLTADTAINRLRNYRDDIDNLMTTISAMERRHQLLASMVQELRDEKKPPSSPGPPNS